MRVLPFVLGCVTHAQSAAVSVLARTPANTTDLEAPYHFLIGTADFIGGPREGPTEMYLAVLESSGEITIKAHLDIGPNPAWFCLGNHDGTGGSSNVAYAMSETYETHSSFNGATAVRVNTRTGTRYLFTENRHEWPADGLRSAPGPTQCEVSPSGRFVVAANYGAGEVAAYPVIIFGALGEGKLLAQYNTDDETSHPHAIAFPPKVEGLEFVYVVDLGLNRIHQYKWEEGSMTPLSPAALPFPTGSGPRHMVFAPQGGHAFVVCETSNQVMALKHDPVTGLLSIISTVPSTPPGFAGKSAGAEIMVAPDGVRIFVSNRGSSGTPSTIASFAFNVQGQTLFYVDSIEVNGIPRGVGLTPDAEFIISAGQDTGLFNVISVGRDGTLFAADRPQDLGIKGEPTSVVFVRTP